MRSGRLSLLLLLSVAGCQAVSEIGLPGEGSGTLILWAGEELRQARVHDLAATEPILAPPGVEVRAAQFSQSPAELGLEPGELKFALPGTIGVLLPEPVHLAAHDASGGWVRRPAEERSTVQALRLQMAPAATCASVGGMACESEVGGPYDCCLGLAPVMSPTPAIEIAPPELGPCPEGWSARVGIMGCHPPEPDPCEAGLFRLPPSLACATLDRGCPEAGEVFGPGPDGPSEVRYVWPDALAEGDGSRERPLRSLAQALVAPRPGMTVVLAAGTFQLAQRLPDDVTLRGACASRTSLDVSDVARWIEGRVTLRDLAVSVPANGLAVTPAASLSIDHVHMLSDVAADGPLIDVAGTLSASALVATSTYEAIRARAPAEVWLERSLLVTSRALTASPGSSTVIRDTALWNTAYEVNRENSLTIASGSVLEAARLVVWGAVRIGGLVTVDHVYVTGGTWVDGGTLNAERGVLSGLVINGGAAVRLTHALLRGSRVAVAGTNSRLHLARAHLEGRSTVEAGARLVLADVSISGEASDTQEPALSVAGAAVAGERVAIFGVDARGEGTMVQLTAAALRPGRRPSGAALSVGEGATVNLSVVEATGCGLLAQTSEGARVSLVEARLSSACPEGARAPVGLQVDGGEVSATNFLIEGSSEARVAVGAGTLRLTEGILRGAGLETEVGLRLGTPRAATVSLDRVGFEGLTRDLVER